MTVTLNLLRVAEDGIVHVKGDSEGTSLCDIKLQPYEPIEPGNVLVRDICRECAVRWFERGK